MVVFVVITPAIGVAERSSCGGDEGIVANLLVCNVLSIPFRLCPLTGMPRPPSIVVSMPLQVLDQLKTPNDSAPISSGAGGLSLNTRTRLVQA
jgi:hypothetical protein